MIYCNRLVGSGGLSGRDFKQGAVMTFACNGLALGKRLLATTFLGGTVAVSLGLGLDSARAASLPPVVTACSQAFFFNPLPGIGGLGACGTGLTAVKAAQAGMDAVQSQNQNIRDSIERADMITVIGTRPRRLG